MMISMNDFLPSRRVIAFVLVPIVTVFALWLIVRYYGQPDLVEQPKETDLEIALAEGERIFQEQDTDKDGLKDWEEFLYQTDERNPDTDGDGSSDGLEVQKGYDPLIAGTGTEDSVEEEKSSGITFYKNDPTLTKTDLLARDIFVTYAELKKGDALDLTDIRDRAIQNAIQDNANVEMKLRYSVGDITVVADTPATARIYKRDYTRATQALTSIQFSEIDLFSRYITQQDQGALVELQKNKEAYQAFVERLASVQAPETIRVVHVELLNNVVILTETIDKILLVDEDPLLGLVAAQKFLEDEDLIQKNTEALLLYFNNNSL